MLGLSSHFWRGRRVLVTGHTGFKGGWLSVLLHTLGARIFGFALPPNTHPSIFKVLDLELILDHGIGDLRDYPALIASLARIQPEIIFHLAAQPLVRESYRHPLETIATNIGGTVNLLEAVRATDSVRAVVVVTSDKCYLNNDSGQPYREDDALGGRDPYSASKACVEIITAAWRQSFLGMCGVGVATARAGNVIGGGDWASDRLVPDALRAWDQGINLEVRYPGAVRPWQHVLEPLSGYLLLAEHLYDGGAAEAWNFGPDVADMVAVGELLDRLAKHWGTGACWHSSSKDHPHESGLLHLDSAKAREHLGWRPRWNLDQALDRVVSWHRACLAGADMRRQCEVDIRDYLAS